MAIESYGKYEVRGRLGAGAMGVVLDVFDPGIQRRAALKLMRKPPPGDAEGEESLARFRREAQAAGRLNHPNIVAIYDYGEDAENAWIAMELVEGRTLRQVLDADERMAVPAMLRVMEQVLAALEFSHARGVVHRDIKPANIMLTTDGTVKLADFGVARIENSQMTQVGTVIGTPAYMAPEQLRGETVDARADLWAAGVVLYQLLTGEKPFEGGFSAVLHKALNTEPVAPSVLSATAPRGFDAVVARALAKRPDERFPDAAAFAKALREATAPPMPAEDATMVAPRPAAPAPPPAASPPTTKSGPPVALIGAGAAVLAAGVAAFLLLGRGGEAPVPPAAPVVAQATPPVVLPTQTPTAAPPAPVATPALTPAAPQPTPVPTPALTPAAPQPAPVATPALTPAAPQPAPVPTPALTPAAPQPAPVATPALTPAAPQPAPVATPALTPAAPQPTPVATPSPAQAAPSPPPQQFAALTAPRLDFRAAASEAAAAPACGLIAAADGPDWLSLRGVLRQGSEAALRRALAARDIPATGQRLALQSFEGPYCPALDLLRPVLAAPDAAPQLRVIGTQPLRAGQLLRFDVTMPDWPAHLYVAYLMKSGEVAHLVPSAQHAAGTTVRLGEPRAGFPGWEVSEPFGTDLMVAVVSEGPLLGPGRPLIESQDAFRQAMAAALAQAQRERRRVLIRPYVIETTP